MASSKTPRTSVLIALLRGINVGGHKRVPMAELRALAEELGFAGVESYIQSGNLVFESRSKPVAVEAKLSTAIEAHFGFAVDVVVRDARAWRRYAADIPFPDAARTRPKLLHLALAKRKLKPGVVASLMPYAKQERFSALSDAIWIDFNNGVAKSKVTPAVLDRVVGSTVTARNYLTVLKLAEMTRR